MAAGIGPNRPDSQHGPLSVRDPARVGGANTYLVYAEVGSDRRTTSRRRRRRAREGRCDLSAPSTGSVLNKHTDLGRGVAKHVLDVAFLTTSFLSRENSLHLDVARSSYTDLSSAYIGTWALDDGHVTSITHSYFVPPASSGVSACSVYACVSPPLSWLQSVRRKGCLLLLVGLGLASGNPLTPTFRRFWKAAGRFPATFRSLLTRNPGKSGDSLKA